MKPQFHVELSLDLFDRETLAIDAIIMLIVSLNYHCLKKDSIEEEVVP